MYSDSDVLGREGREGRFGVLGRIGIGSPEVGTALLRRASLSEGALWSPLRDASNSSNDGGGSSGCTALKYYWANCCSALC